MSADRAKLGCSLRLDEAEDAVQKSANMEVRACSRTNLFAMRCYVPRWQRPTGGLFMSFFHIDILWTASDTSSVY